MNTNLEAHLRKSLLFTTLLLILLSFSTSVLAADAIRFGVPPWPGVTVKTEVVTQLIETIGYDTTQLEIGPPIIYKGFTSDDVDAYMAAWMPAQTEMYEPVKDSFIVANTNLDEAVIGMAVPTYVYEAGVHSIADLDKYADKFNHTIHTIEVGSGMHTATDEMIANDVAGLGDWKMASSTTPVMLSLVQDKVKDKEWVAFHAWKPHWMTIKIDMKFLEGVEGSEKLVTKSWVETLVAKNVPERFPEAFKLLQQVTVTAPMQSEWIYGFGFEEIEPEKVAHDWIAANLDTVATWLDGVKTTDGKPAIDAVKAAYK